MYSLLVLASITFVLACILWYVTEFWKYGHLGQIKGPTPLPFLGSWLKFTNQNAAINVMLDMIKRYGSVVKLWMGPDFYLLVADAELAELTLKKSNTSFKDDLFYRYFRRWLGPNGLFLANGDYYHKLRTMARPVFHVDFLRDKLNDLSYLLDVVYNELSERIEQNEIIDIDPILKSLIFDVTLESSFDMKLDTYKNPQECAYLEAMRFMSINTTNRIFSPWKKFDFLYRFSSDYKKETEALKIIYSTADNIISARRKEIEKDNIKFIESSFSDKKRFKFPIDYLLQTTIDGRPVTQEEIYHHINGGIMAATETSLGTLNFLIYEVAQNQEVQNKLIEEIHEVFGKGKKPNFDMAYINKLKYMELVIKETLRYYSPIPYLARRLNEDVKFRGTTIPKSTRLIFCMAGFHRSPKYFPDPDRFYPERFLDEDKMTPYSFLAFSAGERNCMGIKFGMLLLKTFLLHILSKYTFSSAGPKYQIKPKMNLILSSKNGFHVRIKPRVN